MYQGENAFYKFVEKMLEEVEYCKGVVKKRFKKPLKMTEKDELCFKLMDKCHICNKKYTDKDVCVRDHFHISGKFRGSAHRECNLKLRIKLEDIKIPIIFHNLRSYDSHFIMQQIGEIANMENYMAFILGNHLNFIDSFRFMSSSLDKLVSNLPKEAFKYTSEEFTGKKLSLMLQKCVCPYTWIVLKNLIKRNYQIKNSSIVSEMTNMLQMGNTTMQGKFGKHSTLRQWVNTMTYTLRVTFFCWLMCSKASERLVCNTTN